MQRDLTSGKITGNLLKFAFPLMIGNLLQQCYNVADTWVVGQFLGSDALAAVGSSYTLMTFLTSILLGLCMGSGAAFSMQYGKKDYERLKCCMFESFVLIAGITLFVNLVVFLGLDGIVWLLQTPAEIVGLMKEYLWVIFWGLVAIFLYNYFANLLRAVGNSVVPLVFLGTSAVLNVVLDLVCVLVFHWGVAGAAIATVFSQYVSGIGIWIYTWVRFPELRPEKRHMCWDRGILKQITNLSLLTCVQQSIMNFGILLVQSLVNSFGVATMAAFAAGVKIDSFAYSPAQDFANGFATFVAQNTGAGKPERVKQGIREAALLSLSFCAVVSALVFLFARPLLTLFIDPSEREILAVGVHYLRVEGVFYVGIGLLFLLYAIYRGLERAGMSVVLTVISLGLRVVLAYAFAPHFGVTAIWLAIPIGWFIADAVGLIRLKAVLPH